MGAKGSGSYGVRGMRLPVRWRSGWLRTKNGKPRRANMRQLRNREALERFEAIVTDRGGIELLSTIELDRIEQYVHATTHTREMEAQQRTGATIDVDLYFAYLDRATRLGMLIGPGRVAKLADSLPAIIREYASQPPPVRVEVSASAGPEPAAEGAA